MGLGSRVSVTYRFKMISRGVGLARRRREPDLTLSKSTRLENPISPRNPTIAPVIPILQNKSTQARSRIDKVRVS